jgi:perosamine synthetase
MEIRIPLSRPDIREADIAAVADALRQPRLSIGPRQEEFERILADYIGVSSAIAVNSGTTGLHIALCAFGIRTGDEVIVPSFSFIAPANAIAYVQATPVFAEIDPRTLTLSPEDVERCITPRTRAIVVVHTFGYPADISALLSIVRRHNLLLIEDACEALGTVCDGRKAGSVGHAGVFAFYPNKQITTGEGGMVVTNNSGAANRMKALRNQGRNETNDWLQHEEIGYSYRLSELNCALGAEQMKRIDSVLAVRQTIACAYRERLDGESDLQLLPPDRAGFETSWFTFPVRLADRFTREDRDRIVGEMARGGIACGRYFGPIHLQPAYRGTHASQRNRLRVTEHVAERCIALPLFNQITETEIDEVCRRLLKLVRRSRAATV